MTSDTSVKQPLVPQISHLAQPSPIAAVHSRREDEDEEAYHEQGHHRPEDHGNRTVSHGATRRIPRSRATAAVASTRVFMVDMGVALRWQDERWDSASAKSDERTSSVIGAAAPTSVVPLLN
jgi:hypothetical protein